MLFCPKCGSLAAWDSYFQKNACRSTTCGYMWEVDPVFEDGGTPKNFITVKVLNGYVIIKMPIDALVYAFDHTSGIEGYQKVSDKNMFAQELATSILTRPSRYSGDFNGNDTVFQDFLEETFFALCEDGAPGIIDLKN